MASGKKKILIADDDKHTRNLLEFNLEEAGYQVKAYPSADTVIPAVNEWKPDLVILDIMMPGRGQDGSDVCREIKASPDLRRIPVIMISAITSGTHASVDRIRASLHADAFLQKPFDPVELVQTVRSLLSHGEQSFSLGS